jgi:hypothetical protein
MLPQKARGKIPPEFWSGEGRAGECWGGESRGKLLPAARGMGAPGLMLLF